MENKTLKLAQLIKDWTLPISMVLGVICYFAFARYSGLAPVKPYLLAFIPYLLPGLLFVMLFFTYCKIDPKDLKPRAYQLWLVLFQLGGSCALVAYLLTYPTTEYRVFLEAMLACVIAPMAAVGAVVTTKIGGNTTTATTYTVISSLMTAIAVPIIYPLVEPGMGMTFGELFLKILSKVFPTIVAPLFLALFLRYCIPPVHRYFVRIAKDKAFYLWAICTTVNTAQILHILLSSQASAAQEWAICLGAGVLCAFQFAAGKGIGQLYNDRISSGQCLGQKNTVLSIWIAMTFLTPEAAIAPGAYLLWQNLMNSWQIWHHNKTNA